MQHRLDGDVHLRFRLRPRASDATSSDATSSDATSSDATSPDATGPDAAGSDAAGPDATRSNSTLPVKRLAQENRGPLLADR